MARNKIVREKGTAAWFEASQMRCVDHLRALLAIKMSKSSIAEILRGWDLHSAEIRSGLHSACVIAYARVFTHAIAKTGKITYPSGQLIKANGFDRELHQHILNVRDQIIAHGDYGVFPSTMYLQTIGDERLPVALGINVKSIFGIASRDLGRRYDQHLSVCERMLEELLNRECVELVAEAKNHPEIFNATNNIPEVRESIELDGQLRDFPGPSGAAGRVEDPPFAESLAGYNYITLTHQVALQKDGEFIVTSNGIRQTITLVSKT